MPSQPGMRTVGAFEGTRELTDETYGIFVQLAIPAENLKQQSSERPVVSHTDRRCSQYKSKCDSNMS